jgi:ketosteroid isomerase-like protein
VSAGAPSGVELIGELQRAFGAGDATALAALFHPDFSIEQPASLPHGGRHHGLEGMQRMGATFAEHWQRTIAEPRLIDGGETVVQVTTQTWTATATGRSATVDVVELFSFADGRILEIRVFQQDTHALLQLLD